MKRRKTKSGVARIESQLLSFCPVQLSRVQVCNWHLSWIFHYPPTSWVGLRSAQIPNWVKAKSHQIQSIVLRHDVYRQMKNIEYLLWIYNKKKKKNFHGLLAAKVLLEDRRPLMTNDHPVHSIPSNLIPLFALQCPRRHNMILEILKPRLMTWKS